MMKNDQVPTFGDLRKVYLDLMHLHPDKAGPGEEINKVFQGITEAARIIFEFITNKSDLQPKRMSAECKRMVKCFEESNEVEFKDGCIVFLFDDVEYNDWIKAFAKRIGPDSKLPTNNSFKFTTKSIPEHQISVLLQPLSTTDQRVIINQKSFYKARHTWSSLTLSYRRY